jgi:hypothetical protein
MPVRAGDLDDDPPELVTDLALLAAGEMSPEARMRQNPNLMILFLRQGGEMLPELGYDDDCAQFLPWTLRRAELECIARLAALRDPQLRPLLALLSRFTPLTTDEEVRCARPMLAVALSQLSEGPPPPEPRLGPALQARLADQPDHWDCRRREPGYRRISTPRGWALAEAGQDMWGPPALRSRACAGENPDPAELAGELAAAGCDHPGDPARPA